MAPKKTEDAGAALAKIKEHDAAALAELGDFFDNVKIDGLEDVGGEDLKLAIKMWNTPGLDGSGSPYPKNALYDTITEETSSSVEAVLLLSQKSHRYDSYDNDKNKTNVLCSSEDRKTGTTDKHPDHDPGTERPCKGCPDTGWFRDDKGKPFRKCGDVHTVIAVERLTQRPFVTRFKKTGLKAFRSYLMQHHVGTRIDKAGKRANVPLFVYAMTLSTEMHKDGNYATPVLTRGDMLSREEVTHMHDQAKTYSEIIEDVLDHADAVDSKHDAPPTDAGMSASDFADD